MAGHEIDGIFAASLPVSGIGSLPHISPREALEFVYEFCPDIPYWPQLPQRGQGEQMLFQHLPNGFREIVKEVDNNGNIIIDKKGQSVLVEALKEVPYYLEENASGFFAFLDDFKKRGEKAKIVKGQILGPISALSSIYIDDRVLYTNKEVARVLSDHLLKMGIWQLKKLKQISKKVIIFIDEPCLSILSQEGNQSKGYLEELLDLFVKALKKEGALVGIHSCMVPPNDVLFRDGADMVSYDASNFHSGNKCFFPSETAIQFIKEGGILAVGVIPSNGKLEGFSVSESAALFMESAVELGFNVSKLISRIIVTPSCGLGLREKSQAKQAFSLCQSFREGVLASL